MLTEQYSGATAQKQDGWDKSPRRIFHMRLIEFANPKEYTSTVADAEDFLTQLLPDDHAPTILRYEDKQLPIGRNKLIETL
jgi:hypothetical protein